MPESPVLNNNKSSETMEKCFHCLNAIPPGEKFEDEKDGELRQFCCGGCKTVSKLIQDIGGEKFYDLRGSTTLSPGNTGNEENKNPDDQFAYEEYVKNLNGSCEVFINIENIHCSACVWLNEKILGRSDGVISARINFATGRAHVVWDDARIKLHTIFEIIKSIGYIPKLYAPWKKEEKVSIFAKDLLYRLGVAGFSFGNIMLFSVALYTGYFSGIDLAYKKLLHYVSWILATPAYLYSGGPFLKGAYYGIKNRQLTMDLLLVTGISLAYFYSVYVTITDRGEVYFDSVCMIYFFILIGRYFEARARENSTGKIEGLLSKLPETCILLNNEVEAVIQAGKIRAGDLLKSLPGDRIPVDGILDQESGLLDESFLTGEATPVLKKKFDKILAGSICIDSPVIYFAETGMNDSTLTRLKQVIESAMMNKPEIQRLTDRLASIFIKIIFFVAISVFIYWNFLSNAGLEQALINTIAVLIVACPCALGLAVPTALVINNIKNAENGILLKNLDIVEALSKIDTAMFDKTGTLTTGKLVVKESKTIQNEIIYPILFEVEKNSKHPVGKGLLSFAKEKIKGIHYSLEIKQLMETPGRGIEGITSINNENCKIRIGSEDFVFDEEGQVEPGIFANAFSEKKGTRVYMSLDSKLYGIWILQDEIRENINYDLVKLKKYVTQILLVSGDRQENCPQEILNLPIDRYYFRCKPEDKLSVIEELQKGGRHVLMTGDGINDAATMARSDVGISMGMGADLSIDKSDMVLIRNEIGGIVKSFIFAKATTRIIRQNIVLSLLYNSIMIPLAASGLMLPVICAGFMTLSSFTVLINSSRIWFLKGIK